MVNNAAELRNFILSRPADEIGIHKVFSVLPKIKVETSGGTVVPLVEFDINNKTISVYVQYCGKCSPSGNLVDATGVTTSVLCDDIPCATAIANYNDVMEKINKFVNEMATDGYEVDETSGIERSYNTGQRVDVLVN